MEAERYYGDPLSLSRIELVSAYINGYSSLGAERRAAFEAALRARGLPLPRVPPERPPIPGIEPKEKPAIDKGTFFSYILLIYTGTAVFYCWYYLAERLIRRDFRSGAKHKAAQTAISLFYAAADILVLSLVAGG